MDLLSEGDRRLRKEVLGRSSPGVPIDVLNFSPDAGYHIAS